MAELDSSERTLTRWYDDAKKQRVTTALRRALELENDVKRAQNVSRRLPTCQLAPLLEFVIDISSVA